MGSAVFVGCEKQKAAQEPATQERPAISTADRAMAAIEVQNAYSKHAYYHTIGAHCEEMEDIWVKEDGEFAKTAKWTRMGTMVEEGITLIKQHYCTDNEESKKQKLTEISKVYPEVKDVPENIGIGYGYTIHTQTTPIIEIAGDGKTAKGIWYSPGIGTNVEIRNGKPEISGGWFWEKYAVDFAKEDGKWKIWHLVNVMDPTPQSWGAQQDRQMQAPQGEKAGAGQEPQGQKAEDNQGMKPAADPYVSWSPTTKSKIYPKFPEPYYTFSETFSY